MILSCADFRCDKLISIIATLHGETLSNEEINNMDSLAQYFYLNLNPELLARHFQYRKKVFSQVIVIDGPLEKVKCHASCVEFKARGIRYVHSFYGFTRSQF